MKADDVRIRPQGSQQENAPGSHYSDGGLKLEKSDCCNAQVVYTGGGLKMKVCQKCGRKIQDTVY